MPSKAFRIFAVVTALGLGTGYVLVSLPQGIFGSSKAGIARFDPDAQPAPEPTRKPHMGSSKLGIIVHPDKLSGDETITTDEAPPRPARLKWTLMHGPKSAPIRFDEIFPGPVKPRLIDSKREGRDVLTTPEFWSREEAWKENLEHPFLKPVYPNDPFAR